MPTKSKIKITDNLELRAEIDRLFESTAQVTLAKWAIECAKHVLPLANSEDIDITDIYEGMLINQLWQDGKASVNEVIKAGFKIHAVARQCQTEIAKTVFRAVGHAVAVGHMREHAMVCSDYAIKSIQLAYPKDSEKITIERQWQLDSLKVLKSNASI